MTRWVLALGLVLALLAARPARALDLPVVVEGARVVVRAEAGLEGAARRAAARAARELAAIEYDLEGLPRAERIEVRLVKRMADVAAAAPAGRGAPPWAAGTAYPDLGVVVVAARGRTGELLDAERTLVHELAHMALDRALGRGRVPRWLTEGFAYLHSSEFSIPRATTLGGAVLRDDVVPLAALEDTFPAREDEAALAYAESYDFVAYLARRGRWADPDDDGDRSAFRQLLAELSAGRGLDDAFRRAFGRPFAAVEAEWRETLRARYMWMPLGLLGAFLWVVAAILLVLGWLRRRRTARSRLRQWELEEAVEDAARARAEHFLH